MSQSVLNNLRVLFVDDEAPIREVMRIELPRMGHDVTICEEGKAAIAAIDKNTFDAAIVDLRMPGISGWDVVAHLRTVSPETDIIISTGHGNMEDAIQALRRRRQHPRLRLHLPHPRPPRPDSSSGRSS